METDIIGCGELVSNQRNLAFTFWTHCSKVMNIIIIIVIIQL